MPSINLIQDEVQAFVENLLEVRLGVNSGTKISQRKNANTNTHLISKSLFGLAGTILRKEDFRLIYINLLASNGMIMIQNFSHVIARFVICPKTK